MLIEAEPMEPSTLVPERGRAGASSALRWMAGCLVLFVLALPGNGRAQAAPAAPQVPQAQPPDGGKSGAPASGSASQSASPQNAPDKNVPAQGAPAQGAPVQAAPAGKAPAQGAPVQAAPAKEAPAKEAPAKEVPAKEAPDTHTETPAVVIDESAADTLLGKPVQSTNGDDMGRVIDVVVDRSGMVRAAIIDFGGFLGIGTREIAVDWRVLHFSKDGNMQTIVADLSRNQLRTAPVYKPGEPIIVVGRADAPAAAPSQPAAAAAAPTGQEPAAAVPAAPAGSSEPAPQGAPAQKQKP